MDAETHEKKLREWLGLIEEKPIGAGEALNAFNERVFDFYIADEDAMIIYSVIKRCKESMFPDELEM